MNEVISINCQMRQVLKGGGKGGKGGWSLQLEKRVCAIHSSMM